jgi:hypothetical protein
MIKRILSVFTESTLGFEGQEPGETVVLLLRRHNFTIMFPVGFVILLGLVPVIAWLFLPIGYDLSALSHLFWFVLSMWYLFLWTLLFYFLTLYCLNTVIVTDRRIIESEQYAFFSRKVSELHTYRVQDVSAHTHGFIETLVGYGDISVQTAASEREFVFHKIPNPEKVKDEIMRVVAAHQTKVGLN